MQVSPNSLEAEQTVLGAVLYSEGKCFPSVVSSLVEDDFYRDAHRLIYGAMRDLFQAGEKIDILTVSEWMNENGSLEAGGGRQYINELAMAVTTDKVAPYYCKSIKGYSLKRQIQQAALEIAGEAAEMNPVAYLEYAQQKFMDIAIKGATGKDKATADIFQEAYAKIHQQVTTPNHREGFSTGFYKLDSMISGLQGGKLYTIGARPAMGKSAFVLNLALNVMDVAPVIFFNLEMDPVEQAERALKAMTDSSGDLKKMHDIVQNPPTNLVLLDRPELTPTRLRADVMRYRQKHQNVGMVIVDYLQLMEAPGRSRVEEVALLSRAMKSMSREFKIPFIALSQLSRELEKRQDKRPILSDLRESGAIEQDSDVVMFIYRDEVYTAEKSDKPGMAEIIVAKQRGGAIGTVELAFRPFLTKFTNLGGNY